MDHGMKGPLDNSQRLPKTKAAVRSNVKGSTKPRGPMEMSQRLPPMKANVMGSHKTSMYKGMR